MVSVAYSVGLIQLGILFSVAGLAKRLARARFAVELSVQGLLPPWARRATARCLPAAELFLGIWLVTGVRFQLAATCASALLAAFIGYRIVLRAARRPDAPCGCLGDATGRFPADPEAELTGLVANLTVAVLIAVFAGTGSDRYSFAVSALLGALTAAGLLALTLRQRSNSRRFARVESLSAVQDV